MSRAGARGPGEPGLSQAQLAQALGVSRQAVNSIETDRYTPSPPLAIAMARYFDRSVEEVFHVDDTSDLAR